MYRPRPTASVMRLLTVNARMRSRSGSRIGDWWCRELCTVRAIPIAATANDARVAALLQPHDPPWTMPSVSAPTASERTRAPRRSGMIRRPGARLSITIRRARNQARIPSGRLIRNTIRQL